MITKSAQDTSIFTKALTFTRSARSAWELIIESVKKDRGSVNILLPAYIGFTEREGSGIFDPVQHTQADFSFYGLNDDLSVNYEALQKLMSSGKFNILLVVHYFGFCRNDMPKIKQLCEKYGVIMVEDCAHAFQLWLDNEALGTVGDFAIYSVHKHLATSSGGLLREVSRAVELLPLPDEDKIAIEPALQLLNSDFQGIAQKRRANYAHYAKTLPINNVEAMFTLEKDDVPQTFPVRIRNNLREPLYFYLMEKDIPTIALYYRLIDELSATDYPLAHTISGEILNLPVHQDVNEKDVATVMKEVKAFMESEQ